MCSHFVQNFVCRCVMRVGESAAPMPPTSWLLFRFRIQAATTTNKIPKRVVFHPLRLKTPYAIHKSFLSKNICHSIFFCSAFSFMFWYCRVSENKGDSFVFLLQIVFYFSSAYLFSGIKPNGVYIVCHLHRMKLIKRWREKWNERNERNFSRAELSRA